MNVLLLGASGFIGNELARTLLADGQTVRAAGRDLRHGLRALPDAEWAFCDLRRMGAAQDWLGLLEGIEIVINASGVLQSGLRDDVIQVQERSILALIDASIQAGVRHFVQISAAGADRQETDFMMSKARADAALAGSVLSHTIIRPGLVIGRNGFGGTEMLRAAAGMPVAIEIDGTGPIQCVALADIVEALRLIIVNPAGSTGSFDLVEIQSHSLEDIVALHRDWLGIASSRLKLRIPMTMLRPVSLLADALGWFGWRSPLRSNALAALAHGVRGDPEEARELLGRQPLSLAETLDRLGGAGKADRWHARIASLFPISLITLFFLWLAGGTIGLLRPQAAAALLTETGMDPLLARLAVTLGSGADLAVALGLLFRPTAKSALGAGAALASVYALGAALIRPDLWLDPLGPMVKLLPLIAMMLVCRAMAEER